jgi:hypothetical protein
VKLQVVAPFSTVITVQGDQRRFAAVEGQTFDVDEPTGLALLRDVGGSLRLFVPAAEIIEEIRAVEPAVYEFTDTETAETVVVEMVEVPPEVVAPPRVARTRQIKARPGPKPKARK